MFLTREVVQDADLGDGVAYGGSRLAIAAFVAGAGFFLWLGCWVTVQTGAAADPFYYVFDAVMLALCLAGAAWIWCMRLTVGVHGFRYERPLGRRQFSWRDVLDLQVESVGSRTRQVVVRLRSDTFHDRQFRLPSLPGFSGTAMDIAQSMRERLEAFPEADGGWAQAVQATGGLGRTRSLVSGNLVIDPELGECSVISGSRGWPALAALGVLCLAYIAWSNLSPGGLSMGEDLLKKTRTGNLFTIFGRPDVDIRRVGEGQLQVEIRGLDTYNPTNGEVVPQSTADIACWFIDTAYDNRQFFVRHAYFLGDDDPYDKLRRALRADIDEAAWSSLNSTISRPFPVPDSGCIAIKVINHYGDEILKVYQAQG